MSLYRQQRFEKSGYSVAYILAALPLYQILLLETEKDNLHVQVSWIYLECEFLITELLAYFMHKVTLPLLNCVEVCEQTQLLTIFPELNTDLCTVNMNTLNDCIVI